MKLKIEKMDSATAKLITNWRYDSPYNVYDMEEEEYGELLDGSYYKVSSNDVEGSVVGYFCFGKSARVPSGHIYGAYKEESVIDIGLGLRPNLCGQGIGIEFLRYGLEFGKNKLQNSRFRLTVACFNKRALSLYRNIGFKVVSKFTREDHMMRMDFYVMRLDLN